MAIKVPTAGTVKNATIRDMQTLGVYKQEFNRLITVYAELVSAYLELLKDFEESGKPYEVPTGAGGSKKSPVVATLEVMRKDILAYSDRLCLNPKSIYKDIESPPKKETSKLEAVLAQLGD